MTKRRTTKRSKAKSRKPSRKAKAPIAVHRVVVPPDVIVRVVIPHGPMPVVAADPVRREVVIVPAKEKTFWEKLFG